MHRFSHSAASVDASPNSGSDDIAFSESGQDRHTEVMISELNGWPWRQRIEPTSKPLGNADFTLASSVNLRRRSEASMRIDMAATQPVFGVLRHLLIPYCEACQVTTPLETPARCRGSCRMAPGRGMRKGDRLSRVLHAFARTRAWPRKPASRPVWRSAKATADGTERRRLCGSGPQSRRTCSRAFRERLQIGTCAGRQD